MKSLIAVAAMAVLANWPAQARDALPTVPQPPQSARTLPDTCLGTSCPGSHYPPAGSSPGQSQGQSGLKGPARPWLPPIPPRPGQPPVGPLTPGPALPR